MPITITKRTSVQERLDTLAEIHASLIAMSKEASADNVLDVEVRLYQGNYVLTEPFVLNAEENPGLAHMRISFLPSEGMRPVISSLKSIDARAFTHVSGNIYKYQFEKDENGKYPVFRDFYRGDHRVPLARGNTFLHRFGMPNRKNADDPANEKCFYVDYDEAKRLLDYGDLGVVELTMYLEWEWCTARVGSIDLNDVRERDGVKQVCLRLRDGDHERFIHSQHSCIDIGGREFYFQNHPALLTPNTYSYNCETGELYYCLPEGFSLEWQRFSYPTLENLFVLYGLKGLRLEGLTFTGTTSKYVCENMYYAAQSNSVKGFATNTRSDLTPASVGMPKSIKSLAVLPHAAVLTSCMRDFTVRDCTFRDLGTNAVYMRDCNSTVRVHDSKFMRIGMAALFIGNQTTAWEDPMNRNFDIEIVNNYFHSIGYEYPPAGAVYISMVDGLRLMHNTMNSTASSPITVGWGWGKVDYALGEKINIRDAEIAYNHITDFMMTMRDGAAIYVLGANCTTARDGQFNFMHDNYAEREMYRDASKRGYYMDGSASNWEVWDNVILGVRLPLFSQFHVPVQYTHHNYLHDIYTDYPIDEGNHAPWRDTIVENCYCVTEGKEALFAQYPTARMICDFAGCDLDI